MSSVIRTSVVASDSIQVTLSDSPDMMAATLWIQVKVARAPDRDLPLAVLQAIALRDARDEISEQIRAITQKHGPVP